MRVIAGTARGRRLKELPGMDTRPTTDKVKESMFNIIQFDIEGRNVLDLFGGSGQLTVEALSRGADRATVVERNPAAVKIIRENVAACEFTDRVKLLPSDAKVFLAGCREKFDLVFLDPPYALRLLPKVTAELYDADMLSEGALVICEDEEGGLEEDVMVKARYDLVKSSRYGRVHITILTPKTEDEEA